MESHLRIVDNWSRIGMGGQADRKGSALHLVAVGLIG